MNKKSKRIKQVVTAPVTRAQAESLVDDLARLVNNQRRIQAELDELLLQVRSEYAAALGLCEESIGVARERLKLWALANPAEFENAKSVEFAAGKVGFRTGMPKLVLLSRKWNWASALAAVRTYFPAFIRDKPEIDAEAIVAQREDEALKLALPMVGLKVVQEETFFVEPRLEHFAVRQTGKKEEKVAA